VWSAGTLLPQRSIVRILAPPERLPRLRFAHILLSGDWIRPQINHASPRRVDRQPQRVDPVRRIAPVPVSMHTSLQSDRVRADEEAKLRVVIPEAVVVEPRLIVGVLALKA